MGWESTLEGKNLFSEEQILLLKSASHFGRVCSPREADGKSQNVCHGENGGITWMVV